MTAHFIGPILTQVWVKGIKRWLVRYTKDNRRVYYFLDATEEDEALEETREFLKNHPSAAAHRGFEKLTVRHRRRGR